MKYKVIGIAGPARSGKDTAANYISNIIPEYKITSFADPIKHMLMVGLGMSEEQMYGGDIREVEDERYGKSPRQLMQTLGTEWGRDMIHPLVWVNAIESKMNDTNSDIIIPDVRFESEADFVRNYGVLIHITGRNPLKSKHKSEKGIYISSEDIVLQNSSTLDDYYIMLDDITNNYLI